MSYHWVRVNVYQVLCFKLTASPKWGKNLVVVLLVKRCILSRDKSRSISICINISIIHRHIDNTDAV